MQIDQAIKYNAGINTPCYYKDFIRENRFIHINNIGTLIDIRPTQITVWFPHEQPIYHQVVQEMLSDCIACERSDFEKQYHKIISGFTNAIRGLEGQGALPG